MSSQRELQLARLLSILKTTSIKTVIVCNSRPDMSDYTKAEIPLIAIIPSGERPNPYLTGRMAMWRMSAVLTCYYLDDINSDIGDQEALLKEMKDALGGDPTLNNTCASVEIQGTRPSGEFPLWEISLDIEIAYEKKISMA